MELGFVFDTSVPVYSVLYSIILALLATVGFIIKQYSKLARQIEGVEKNFTLLDANVKAIEKAFEKTDNRIILFGENIAKLDATVSMLAKRYE